MKQNVGALDATIRVGIGFALLFTAFLMQPPLSGVAYVAALIVAITGFSGQCLLYRVLGINTCR